MDFDPRHPGRALTTMNVATAALIVQFLISVAFNLMGSFMPLFLSSDLNQTLIEATYWTGIAALVSSLIMAFTAPFWGWMCDRVGTKKVLIVVMAGNIIVYAGMAVSTDVNQIVLFRGLQGCFGGISTVMFAIVASTVSAMDLKRALSYQMAAMTMGGLIAPGIGGLLAEIMGYRLTLASSALLFVLILPIVTALNLPPAQTKQEQGERFSLSDFKSILPDIIALVLLYICISFITPAIPWFLESLGVASGDLLTYTAVATILNGIAYAIATPFLTRVATGRILPILSVGAAAAIMATAFVFNPFQFILLRVVIGAIQSGTPPNLLGGKSGRKGTGMGFLNSARFLGMAIGPFLATSILDDGMPPKPLYMFGAMSVISLVTAFFIYITHTREKKEEFRNV